MQIRSFQLSDYRSVAQLFEQVLSVECCEETMEAFARQLSWDSDLVLVAENEKAEIVGALIGTIDNHQGYMYRIAVHPDFRRQGVGKALIGSMAKRFRQRKVLNVLIPEDKHNALLRPFYEALGVRANQFAERARLSIVAG